jgi:hypothetical protein
LVINSSVILIDGKALKRIYDHVSCAPTMMLSAFAAEVRITLSSLDAKGGNEVEAAPELFGLIDLVINCDSAVGHVEPPACVKLTPL